ncbi:MAG: TonB-dependent receptor, partial [Bryobacterales bacterium]|nr:TonB-dependent receptor [Bryobacterales bacterium]
MRSFADRAVLSVAIFISIFAAVRPVRLLGQAATASISGRVTDSSSAAVPMATLTIKNTATSATQTVNTDEQGRYTVADLPIGPYEITVAKAGFQNALRSGLTLTVGSAPVIDFQLAVGQSTQTVEVSAQVSQVETTTAAVSSLVNQTQMRELPLNGRDWEQLILLAPGVLSYPQGGSSALTSVANAYSISGTRPEGYANLLDGEDMVNWWQRNAGGDVTGTTLGIDSIAEFQTLTGTYGAQYAGNGGAIIGVTKSGTNEFHGSLYEFFRNSDLDARGFFDPGNSAPPFRRNQYGATIGGPIKKNKVFFFANYEGIRQVLDTTYVNYVPGPNFVKDNCSAPCVVNPASAAMMALYPAPNAGLLSPDVGIYNFVGAQTTPEDFGVTRVDWNISDKDGFFGRYEADFGNRTTNEGLGLWPLYDTTHNQFLTLGERHVFSPSMVNQFTASYSRPWTSENQPAEHPALQIFTPAREDAYVAVPNLSPLGASFVNPFRYLQNKFTEKDDLTWIKGSHTLHIGGMFQRQQLNPYVLVFWNGFYVFQSGIAGCATSDQCFLTGNPLLLEGAPNGGTNSYRAERYDAVQPYFQDDWKVSNKLTINFGLRYDWETNPIEIHNLFTNVVGPPFAPNFVSVPHAYQNNPANRNFDPRVGLAWDVFGDHKTAVRAGFGIFHDPYTTYAFSSAYVSSPPYDTQLQFFFAGDPNWPKPFVGSAIPSFSQTTGTYYGTNTTPYSLEYTISIQHELPWNNLFTVGYQGTRGVHLLAFHDFNAPIPTVINGVDYFATENGGPCALNAPSTSCVQNPRPVPALGSQDLTAPSSYSSYNALQVGLTHRASSNLVYQFAYTWSHCIDSAYTYGGLGFNNVTSAITNPYDWNADKGNCSFDLRENISFNAVYLFPFKGSRWKEGWQLSGLTAWHTGVNFSLGENDQADLGNTFDSERPNYAPNAPGCNNNPYGNQSVNAWINLNCFTASQYGTVGNLGRNNMVGPGYAETDIGVTKNTRITERVNLQFRAEIFNVFNHSNFSVPGAFGVGPQIINAGTNCGPTSTFSNPSSTACFAPSAAAITSLVGSGGLPDVA